MSIYIVIDKKKQTTYFGVWPFSETVELTLSLVKYDEGLGLMYEAKYWGIVPGHASGGPFHVTGNITKPIHEDPKIVLQITNWSEQGGYISMHVKITVHGLGVVFDQNLGGKIPADNFIEESLQYLKKCIEAASKKA